MDITINSVCLPHLAGKFSEIDRRGLKTESGEEGPGEKGGYVGCLVTHPRLGSWVAVSGTHISCLCACGIFNTKEQLTRELAGQKR